MELENHPIPQDVTGFQFKLIGEMTVKQFAFLAAGSILAYILFILPFFFLIKITLAIFAFLGGLIFAFIPIHGRPANIMLSYFIKSLFSPDQYIYQKQGGDLSILANYSQSPLPRETNTADVSKKISLEHYLNKMQPHAQNKLDKKEMNFVNSIASINSSPSPQLITQPNPSFINSPYSINDSYDKNISQKKEAQDKDDKLQQSLDNILEKKHEDSAKIVTEEVLEDKSFDKVQDTKAMPAKHAQDKPDSAKDLQDAEKSREKEDKEKNALFEEAKQKALDLQSQLEEALAQKTKLEEEFLALKKKEEIKSQQTFSPSQGKTTSETPNVRRIPNTMAQAKGLAIAPDVANVISGIVKDPRENVLPNMLVEIKDKNGNPVRAFKTNQLGQFASATPLSNGEYIIEVEDSLGKNKFDLIEIFVEGQIIEPLEIISTDQREELRRQLFGGTN